MGRAIGVGGIPAGPHGQFAGNAALPTDLVGTITAQTLDSLTGDPGIRIASSRGRRQFRGLGPGPQGFLAATSPASDEALADIAVKGGTRSRAMGQWRGNAAMSNDWPTTGLES